MFYWLIIALIALFFMYELPKLRARSIGKRAAEDGYYTCHFFFDPNEDQDIVDRLCHAGDPAAYLMSLLMVETGTHDQSKPTENHLVPDVHMSSPDEVKCVRLKLKEGTFDDEIAIIESWPRGTKDEHMKGLICDDMSFINSDPQSPNLQLSQK